MHMPDVTKPNKIENAWYHWHCSHH